MSPRVRSRRRRRKKTYEQEADPASLAEREPQHHPWPTQNRHVIEGGRSAATSDLPDIDRRLLNLAAAMIPVPGSATASVPAPPSPTDRKKSIELPLSVQRLPLKPSTKEQRDGRSDSSWQNRQDMVMAQSSTMYDIPPTVQRPPLMSPIREEWSVNDNDSWSPLQQRAAAERSFGPPPTAQESPYETSIQEQGVADVNPARQCLREWDIEPRSGWPGTPRPSYELFINQRRGTASSLPRSYPPQWPATWHYDYDGAKATRPSWVW